MSTESAKFWSDDLDVDLLNVFPHLRSMLGATLDVPIWTIGRTTYDRLNCPAAWNTDHGLTSLLWLEKPNFPRDEHGWLNAGGYVCNDPEVEGTWLEWLRDMWAHSHGWCLQPYGIQFSAIDYNRCFYPIMSHLRGWSVEPNIDHAYKMAKLWLIKANRKFARAVEAFRIGRYDMPYFAAGAVPMRLKEGA